MIVLVCDFCGKKFEKSWIDYRDASVELCPQCASGKRPPEGEYPVYQIEGIKPQVSDE
jgi:ribosome-binding protein aMBF1 (putative translation factor)